MVTRHTGGRTRFRKMARKKTERGQTDLLEETTLPKVNMLFRSLTQLRIATWNR